MGILLLAFWIVGFPYYLYWRSRYGAKNMLVGGIGVALLFFGILVLVSMAADDAPRRIKQAFNEQLSANMEEIHEQGGASLEKIHKQVAFDAVKQYEITERNGSAMDRYVQASLVAAAYLQANDEAMYKIWKDIERMDGLEAGIR